MCFNEIPIEFDETGEPYLADDADDIAHPDDDATGCGCGQTAELGVDPEGAYDAILEELPEAAKAHLTGETPAASADVEGSQGARARDSAGGD